jgi:hypothetical protein
MTTPSRMDIPMVQQGIDLMDFELKRQGEKSQRDLAEGISARGLVSSSIDIESQAELARNLEHQRQQRMFNLSQLMAQTWSQDRSAAANIGTQAVSTSLAVPGQSFEQQLAAAEFSQQTKVQDRAQELEATGMDRDEAFRQAQSEIQETQFGSTQQQQERIQNRAFELQQQGMDQDEAFRQAQSEIQETQFGSEQQLQQRALELQDKGLTQDDAFRRAQMEQQQGQFVTQLQEAQEARLQQLGLDTTGLEQSAQALKQQAALEGRSLDITEAYNKAEAKLRIDALRQEAEIAGRQFDLQEAEQTIQKDQYAAEHAQRRDQFADSLGLSTKQYQEEVDARMSEYGDRNAERLLRQGLQEGTLEYDAAQAALNRSLEREALKLQQSGIDAETAWRRADRDVQNTLETAAQKLQATGMSNEVAWRKAETEMAETIQRRRDEAAAALQAAGIKGDVAAALLDRSHALTVQTAEAEDDVALQKQADDARQKLETDLAALGVTAAVLDRKHDQVLQNKRNAIQQKGYDSETAWREALNTHEKGQRTKDRIQETQETERKLETQENIAREASFTAMYDSILQYAEGVELPADTRDKWLEDLEDMRAVGLNGEKAEWMAETDDKWVDDWTKNADGFWHDGDQSGPLGLEGRKTQYRHSTTPTSLTDAEMTANLDQTGQNWQQGWTKNANGKWFDASGAPTDYWHTGGPPPPDTTVEEQKAQWMTETDGDWVSGWTIDPDTREWLDGDREPTGYYND